MFVPGKYFKYVVVIFLFPYLSLFADDLLFSPDKFVLNTLGSQEDLLAIVHKSMPAGYYIDDFQLTLAFDGTQITDAYAVRYCTVDEVYLINFDWDDVVGSPELTPYIGTTVVGSISGTVILSDTQGNTIHEPIEGSGSIEVLGPSWMMSIFKSELPPASDDILISYDNDPGSSPLLVKWDRGQGTETNYGQTFRFTQPVKLDKVTLKIKTSGVDISDKVVVLYIGYGYYHPTDSRLAGTFLSPTAKLPSELGSYQTWYLTFDFIDQYLLPNRNYAFMLRFVSASSGSGGQAQELAAYVCTMGHYAYDDGAAFYVDGDCYKTLLNNELVFFLHGDVLTASPILGDVDIDYEVDLSDFAAIAAEWLDYPGCCYGADISCDTIVNLDDIEYLAQNWLEALR